MDQLSPASNRRLDQRVLSHRGPKNPVDSRRPYAFLVEQERDANGQVVDIATLFLTNRECPLRCTMCDLWKNTLDQTIEEGMIPHQIEWALSRLPTAQQIKLYNSGNFFDPRAIPKSDHERIADCVQEFDTVIVENHPRFVNRACFEFADRISSQLEVAIGLETIHPRVLPTLNKQMTPDSFARACQVLLEKEIELRAFLLLRPPGLSEEEGVEWALRSLEFAFRQGVRVAAIIPTRTGNGMLDAMQRTGQFTEPSLTSLERVMDLALASRPRQRVFVDLWDAKRFSKCDRCFPSRLARLERMNLTQRCLPGVSCEACSDD